MRGRDGRQVEGTAATILSSAAPACKSIKRRSPSASAARPSSKRPSSLARLPSPTRRRPRRRRHGRGRDRGQGQAAGLATTTDVTDESPPVQEAEPADGAAGRSTITDVADASPPVQEEAETTDGVAKEERAARRPTAAIRPPSLPPHGDGSRRRGGDGKGAGRSETGRRWRRAGAAVNRGAERQILNAALRRRTRMPRLSEGSSRSKRSSSE